MIPDASDNQILEMQRTIVNRIVAKLNTIKLSGPVAVAIEMIMTRIVASGNSLQVLQKYSPHDCAFDAASILASIYDVMLQGLYIMADSTKQEERAQLYLNFMDIERKQRIELLDANDTALAKHISSSPERSSAEPKIMRQFDAVKADYEIKKGKFRNTWYPGNLRDLAKEVGYESEYEVMQKFLSGVVHSSPLTIKEGPFVNGFLLMDWQWRFAVRILGAYAKYKSITLEESEQYLVDSARENVFKCLYTRRE